MIWKLARPEARVIRPFKPFVSKDHNEEEVPRYSSAPVPSMLHACQQSRSVALKWYTFGLKRHGGRGGIYFDYDRDFVYTRQFDLGVTFMDDRKLLKNIAMQLNDSDENGFEFVYTEDSFRAMESLMLVDPADKMIGNWAVLSEIEIVEAGFEWQKGTSLMVVHDAQTERFLRYLEGDDTTFWRPAPEITAWPIKEIRRVRYVAGQEKE